MNSPCLPSTLDRNILTNSVIAMPSSGIAARTSSSVGKGWREGVAAREPSGEPRRRILGRPSRVLEDASVSLPEPEPPPVALRGGRLGREEVSAGSVSVNDQHEWKVWMHT